METSGANAHNLHAEDIDKLQMKNLMIAKTDNGTVYVESKAKLEPLFMQAFGYPKLDLTVTSEATTKAPQGLEIVLAFDNTYSMNFDSRWDAAVSTVKNTLEDMQKFTGQSKFKVSLVPFSDAINIGQARSNWINGTPPAGWTGCVTGREKNIGGFQWALDDTNPHMDSFPYLEPGRYLIPPPNVFYYACPDVPITGPTNNVNTITDAMDKMTPKGTGRFDTAMAWSWRLLSPKWRGAWGTSDYPARTTDEAKKKIIFVSDGNTEIYSFEMDQTRTWGYNQGSETGFEHMVDLCTRIKAEGIEIYMLKIVGNDHANSYFQQCASTADHYYTVSEPEHIPIVFADILNGLEAELRLAR